MRSCDLLVQVALETLQQNLTLFNVYRKECMSVNERKGAY